MVMQSGAICNILLPERRTFLLQQKVKGQKAENKKSWFDEVFHEEHNTWRSWNRCYTTGKLWFPKSIESGGLLIIGCKFLLTAGDSSLHQYLHCNLITQSGTNWHDIASRPPWTASETPLIVIAFLSRHLTANIVPGTSPWPSNLVELALECSASGALKHFLDHCPVCKLPV